MMSDWETKKLGILLTQRKEQVVLDPDIEYILVTISNKGDVRLREKKKGADISAKNGYIARAGDFIYSRLSVHTGAFGIVPPELDNALITNEMPCFEIDEYQIYPKVLVDLVGLPTFLRQLKQLTKGMGRVRIKESMMLSLSLVLPPLTEQSKLIRKIDYIKTNWSILNAEITRQQTLLKKLRQQILQEAIEGKLTKDWRAENPDVESASELLKRIQIEKSQLIKDKKIKKQNPLPPISEKEIPFELPDGWVWCRTGVLLNKFSTGPFGSMLHQSDYVAKGIPLVNPTNIVNGSIVPNKKMMINEDTRVRLSKYILKTGEFIIARRGDLSKCAIISNNESGWLCGTGSFFIQPSEYISKDFFLKVYRSAFFQQQLADTSIGQTMANLNQKILNSAVFLLPPLPEQKAIVAKVEKLLTLCDQLQTQITTNQTHAKQLMQAVLKEAFLQN